MTVLRPFRGLAALAGDAAPLGGVVLCAACFALARLVRYRLIEPEAMGAACEDGGPAWCPLRTGLIVFTEWRGFAWLALAAAALALISALAQATIATRVAAAIALAAGGVGMVLYNATLSVPAVVLALLCLALRR